MREQLIKIANMQEYEYKLEKKRIEKARQEATNKAIESTTKEELNIMGSRQGLPCFFYIWRSALSGKPSALSGKILTKKVCKPLQILAL